MPSIWLPQSLSFDRRADGCDQFPEHKKQATQVDQAQSAPIWYGSFGILRLIPPFYLYFLFSIRTYSEHYSWA